MKGTVLLVGFVMAFALCVGVAQADVLYDTLPGYDAGQGGSVLGADSIIKAYLSEAQPFTVSSGNFTLSSVKIAAFWAGSQYGCTPLVSLSLLADNSGVPGSEIESLGSMSATQSTSIIQFNSSTHPLLDAGKTYWVGVFPGASNTWVGWCSVGSHTPGLIAQDNGSGWTALAYGVLSAMKVNAAPAVPEPSALLALCSGVLGLAGFAARHRK
jgi:hypothetical protein